jgi:rod shape-determining protein MreD
MKKILSYILLSLGLILIQGWLSCRGIKPNLALVVVASSGMLGGFFYGLLTGFTCGILIDYLSSALTGINILYLTLTGSIIGCFAKYFYWEKIKTLIFIVFLISLLYGFFNITVFFLMGTILPFKKTFMQITVPETIYSVLLSPFIFLMFRHIKNRV